MNLRAELRCFVFSVLLVTFTSLTEHNECAFYPCSRFENVGLCADCRRKSLTEVPVFKTKITPIISLDLSFNMLSVVTRDSFLSVPEILVLNMSHNNIHTIDHDAFRGLSKVLKLDLSTNSLRMNGSTFRDDTFAHITSIEELNLRTNTPSDSDEQFRYPSASLSSLKSLKSLLIDGLQYQILGDDRHTLDILTNLTMSGDAGFCRIKNVSSDFFTFMPQLTHVTLSKCSIGYIHRAAFLKVSHIRTVDFSFNSELSFDGIAESFVGLANLNPIQKVNLNSIYNQMDVGIELNEHHLCWMRNTSLVDLSLSYNALETIKRGTITKCFPANNTLRTLNLRDNKLAFDRILVNWEIENLNSLEYLDLSRNFGRQRQINTRGGTFSKLKHLALSDCSLRSWNYASYFKGVQMLDLSKNWCAVIRENFFSHATEVMRLDIKENYLGLLLGKDKYCCLFQSMVSLEILDMSLNMIHFMCRDMLLQQSNLTELRIRNNRMVDFTLDLRHMARLILVDLSSNLIFTLSPETTIMFNDMWKRNNKLKLDLTENIIGCYCSSSSRDYVNWLLENQDKIVYGDGIHYKCKWENGSSTITTLLEMKDALDLACAEYTSIIIFASLSIFCSVMVVCAGVIYQNVWKVRYLYYLSRAKYHGNSNKPKPLYTYDAFVVYAEKDYKFVTTDMVKNIEGESQLRLCLSDRDFLPGHLIGDTILLAVQQSRHCVFILSEAFVADQWCMYAFSMSRMESIYANRNVIILVDYLTIMRHRIPAEIEELKILGPLLTFATGYKEMNFWESLKQEIIND